MISLTQFPMGQSTKSEKSFPRNRLAGRSLACLCRWRAVSGFALGLTLASSLAVPELDTPDRTPAPPPSVPALTRQPSSRAFVQRMAVPTGTSPYTIGSPTDLEQLYLEYINRARRNPAAEGARLKSSQDADLVLNFDMFSVDLDLMANAIASLPAAPPLSFNPLLTTAARLHSQDMLDHVFQAHNGSDGRGFAERATDEGYSWINIGENVFAYAQSVEHGHAGFEVDWGNAPSSVGGMQNPPGHRLNIHDATFREIGIGIVTGTKSPVPPSDEAPVGPQLVTQDFGNRQGLSPFVTGVVYYDLNGNSQYDLGEGVGGVRVVVPGSTFYGVSANSGGYSVPVPGPGSYSVTVQVPGLADVTSPLSVTNDNVKLDHVLSYSPPVLSGPDRPAVGQDNTYTFPVVGGATRYQWRSNRLIPVTGSEGAEAGLAGVTAQTTPGYAVIDNVVRAAGQNSFHLAHPRPGGTNSAPEDQYLQLNGTFRVRSDTQLRFASRLSWAASDQVARAQISVNTGLNWQDVWTQVGTGNVGDSSFNNQLIPLGNLAGQEINVRFVYDYLGGTFFSQTDAAVGFHIDEIAVFNGDRIADEVVAEIPATPSFPFQPSEIGTFELSVRPRILDRLLPWGPGKTVVAQISTTPVLRITSVRRPTNGGLQIGFSVTNSNNASYQIQSALDPAGPWTVDEAATVQPGTENGSFLATSPSSTAAQRFFRVVTQ